MAGKFQTTLKGIIDFLRSREAILVVLVMALMAQLPHTAVVFNRLSTTTALWLMPGTTLDAGFLVDWTHAYVAAISIELAVLMFVVRGKILLSWLFAACSIAMNMIYYWQPSAGWLQSVPFWGALLWAAILPVAIAFYSHEIGNGKDKNYPDSPLPIAKTKTVKNTLATDNQPTMVDQTATSPHSAPVNADVVSAPTKVKKNKPAGAKTPYVPDIPQLPEQPSANKMDRALALLSEGLTNAQVAQELGVAETTVRGYIFRSKQQSAISNNNSNDEEV